jgi:hypothetical protein
MNINEAKQLYHNFTWSEQELNKTVSEKIEEVNELLKIYISKGYKTVKYPLVYPVDIDSVDRITSEFIELGFDACLTQLENKEENYIVFSGWV